MRRLTRQRLLAAVPEIPEAAFQVAVCEYAGLQHWKVFHVHDSRREVVRSNDQSHLVGDRAAAGWPDLVLVRDRIVYAELKAESGRLSVKQREWLDALRAAGGEVYVWRPSQWDEIEGVLGLEPSGRRAA